MKVMPEVAKARKVTESSSGGGGDDAAGALEPDGHRRRVVAAAVVLLLDAGEQEHLVVHRQPEGDAEHQDRRGDVESGRWAVKSSSPAPLPSWKIHTMAPKVAVRRQEVEHDGLEGHHHAAEHQEQQHEGGQGDERGGPRHQRRRWRPSSRRTGPTCPPTSTSSNGASSARTSSHQRLALGRDGLDGRHDAEPGARPRPRSWASAWRRRPSTCSPST